MAPNDGYILMRLQSQRTLLIKDVDFVIVDNDKVLSYQKTKDGIVLFSKMLGASRVIVITKNGTTLNYVVNVGRDFTRTPIPQDGKNYKTFTGFINYYGSSSLGESSLLNQYSLSLGAKTQFTDDLSASVFLNQRNSQDLFLYRADLNYKEYFLRYSFLSDYITLNYYNPAQLRGFETGWDSPASYLSVWGGKEGEINSSEIQDDEVYRGVFFSKRLENATFSFSSANSDERSIPAGVILLRGKRSSAKLGYSLLGDQSLIDTEVGHTFEEKSFLYLKNINFSYGLAENGSYGLTYQDNLRRENYGVGFNFANVIYDETELPEYKPGLIMFENQFSSSSVETNRSDRYYGRLLYGKDYRITFQTFLHYDRMDSLVDSYSYSYNPRLNIYLKGDKTDGIYLETTYRKNYDEFESTDTTRIGELSTLGLYRNKFNFFYGGYIGSQSSQFENTTQQSSVYGLSSGYTTEKMNYNVFYQKSFNNNSEVENLVGNVSYRHDRTLFIKGALRYRKQESGLSGIKVDDTIASLLVQYRFEAGERPLNKIIYDSQSSLSGKVYNDKNLNGKRDSGEETISGAKVSIIKAGTDYAYTDDSGEYSIPGFEKGVNYSINVEKEGFISPSTMVKMDRYSEKKDIPLYEYSTKKVYATGFNHNELVMNYSCQNGNFRPTSEVYTNYVLVYLPKHVSCEIVPDFTENEVLYYVADTKNEGDSVVFDIQVLDKVLNFQLEKSKTKNVLIEVNGQSLSLTEGQEKRLSLKPFKGDLKVTGPKNCRIPPNISRFSYKSVPNNFFIKISCF